MEFITRSEINNLSKKNKIIGFGAGLIGEKTVKFLNGKIEYFIDNNPHKIGDNIIENVPVYTVEQLSKEDADELVIVICSEKYEEMREQLKENHNKCPQIFLSPLLKDYMVFKNLNENVTENLLVSAYGAAGGLYNVDCKNEVYQLLWEDSLRGMEVVNGKIIVSSEYGGLYQINSIEPFEKKKLFTPDKDYQFHGLSYWEKEEVLLAVSASQNSIFFFDINNFEIIDNWRLSEFETTGVKTRGHHINDIEIKDDYLLMSMISRSGWWQQGVYDGGIYELNLKEKKNLVPVIDSLVFPHSVKIEEDSIYTLESLNGNVRKGSHDIVASLPGFIRGFDKEDSLLYIGQARNRRVSEASSFMNGVSADSGIYILDENTKMFRFLKLPDLCDVYNVRILNKDIKF